MGEKIEQLGWEHYRGGLDNKSDANGHVYPIQHVADSTTGSHSYYTVLQGKEVMFHVSTLLPYSKDNPQQVHIHMMRSDGWVD